MTTKKITVAASLLTGTIYAGNILKSGVFSQFKHDVTDECITAVANHILKHQSPAIVCDSEGNVLMKIDIIEDLR
jgi:hypothetical protein